MSSVKSKNETRRRILLVTLETVSKTMAGPAIRCLELAKQLADECDVVMASPVAVAPDKELTSDSSALGGVPVKVLTGLSKSSLYSEAMKADILIVQSNVLKPFPRLAELGKYLVVDLYDPYLFAVLVQYKDDPVAGSASYRLMHRVLENHMVHADFSMCASETQRDYWLGRYCAIGRLTPEMYRFDPSLRKVIDVVPFGLQDKAAARTGSGLGIRNNKFDIGDEDKVLLWGGGIWDWFDPLTVIKAIALVKEKQPRIKLYFMGWKSPNPKVEVMGMAHRSMELARELGLLDKHVFFEDDWIPYNDRVNYLLDADIAVSAHFDLPETRYSFRTRILDYLWVGLPVLSTGGDPLSEEIDRQGAGYALPYESPEAWAEKIDLILKDGNLAQSLKAQSLELSERYSWNKTSRALVQYCREPYHLPAFERPTMPNLAERVRAVYSRGGTDLLMKRSKEIVTDLFK